MGYWGVLFGLLLSGGIFCAALQSLNTNGTVITSKRVWTWTRAPTQLRTTDHHSIKREQSRQGPFSVSQRLWIHQLKRPAAEVHVESLQTLEAKEPTLQPTARDDILKTIIQGPDLDPPIDLYPKVVVDFEQRVPVPAHSLAVQCSEGEVIIEVKENFLGNGQLIQPTDLTLGGCGLLHVADHMLYFQTELHGCGSTKKMTDEALIYTFSLTYSPAPVGSTLILKTNPSVVLIECHYPRRHYVSSDAMMPHWQPFASSLLTEQQLYFSLRLMTEEWQSQRSTSVYYKGEMMHIEASTLQGHHVPLRVYVDRCVATTTPAPNSQPAYTFIDNHGCLVDAKLTGAKSYFMQRSREDKLAFQLKAFNFDRDHRNLLYITCWLMATGASVPVNLQQKACSFLVEANRWVASGGDNKLCSCCESSCSEQRRKRDLGQDVGLFPHGQWERMAPQDSIQVEKDTVSQPESNSTFHTQDFTQVASSRSSTAVSAVLAGVLLAVMTSAICNKVHKSTIKRRPMRCFIAGVTLTPSRCQHTRGS
ncbi:zona pellucida sperm-binding protein 3-like isoform X2 [Syngnathoides biaculeatus]|uniref:zona pellucida sperm-binding protein 3-like isoform X2 n=1 Tax=Syngnathoides biaculeatus TaxID=300417 RepID=UPI002ADE7C91|nr:zona pellucida sperm-binding protein 3-like isoform X2 [Syngnathoides biaculeatus]